VRKFFQNNRCSKPSSGPSGRGLKQVSVFASVLVFLALCSDSNARLRDTISQCEAKYGPLEPSDGLPDKFIIFFGRAKAYQFTKAGLFVNLITLDDLVVAMAFIKLPLNTDGSGSPLSREQINILLAANKVEGQWIAKGKNEWKSEDGNIEAKFEKNVLVITDESTLNNALAKDFSDWKERKQRP
jgi:hypothetical protein